MIRGRGLRAVPRMGSWSVAPPRAPRVTRAFNDFSWNASPETGDQTVTGYTLYWSETSGGPYSNSVNVGNVTTYRLPYLGPRYYVMTATNAGGTSGFSSEIER